MITIRISKKTFIVTLAIAAITASAFTVGRCTAAAKEDHPFAKIKSFWFKPANPTKLEWELVRSASMFQSAVNEPLSYAGWIPRKDTIALQFWTLSTTWDREFPDVVMAFLSTRFAGVPKGAWSIEVFNGRASRLWTYNTTTKKWSVVKSK